MKSGNVEEINMINHIEDWKNRNIDITKKNHE